MRLHARISSATRRLTPTVAASWPVARGGQTFPDTVTIRNMETSGWSASGKYWRDPVSWNHFRMDSDPARVTTADQSFRRSAAPQSSAHSGRVPAPAAWTPRLFAPADRLPEGL